MFCGRGASWGKSAIERGKRNGRQVQGGVIRGMAQGQGGRNAIARVMALGRCGEVEWLVAAGPLPEGLGELGWVLGVASVNQLQRSATGVRRAIPDATEKTGTHIIEKISKHCGGLRVFHCESSLSDALGREMHHPAVHTSYLQSAETVTRQLTRSHVPVSDQAQRSFFAA